MKEWLIAVTEPTIVIIDMMAYLIVVIGTVQAFVAGMHLVITRDRSGRDRRQVWLTYARWLVAALTFQLAADIIESSIAPSWESIAQLGAVAVIRTFLNYFLDRDLAEVRERQHPEAASERTG
ncbi:putative membrane protein [Luteimonas cucumeris]|uniref:Putative membrane protein n=1 Tax=Luteimonas cucumeris TaxID=985012 RepID=A0A562LBP9_9GAMM|nr:DUF1622 domain-containing protein [Luteimonas cucumeris]TWI04965.1 putative membrane protein [Luteimonas cucumeris]